MKIVINNHSIELTPNIQLNELRNLQPNKKWWNDIIDFIEEWANDKPTVDLKTSGSTGEPKIIHVEKSKLWVSATKTCDYFQLNESCLGLLCLSASYIAGKMMLVRAMVSGMRLICVEPSQNPVSSLSEKIDFAAMVPMQVYESLKCPEQFNLLNYLIIGGGQVPRSLINELLKHKVIAYETFGMTETLSHIAVRQIAPELIDYFVPFNGVYLNQGFNDVMVVDFPELGIYRMKTNDIIEIIDNQGLFKWKGRADFIINSGGIKFSPEEIEAKIEHLISNRFCISSVPDDKLGQKVVLVIEGEPFETSELFDKIKEILPHYSNPKEIKFLKNFPLTESGKIKRKDLVTFI